MLTLNDGRSELWQWDTGRTLAVDADCSQVHFSNKVFGRSLDVDVIDGVAAIPDILLQTDKELTAWAFVGTPENGYTKISKVFKVNKRNKPADYVFTPTDQTTLEYILDRIENLEKRPNGGNGGITKEVDPTVPDWAKQPQKPKYTAAEVGALPDTTKIPSTAEDVGALPATAFIPKTAADLGAILVHETATVGQTIIVKAVDENGKPTEWEAANKDKEWKLLRSFSIPEEPSSDTSGIEWTMCTAEGYTGKVASFKFNTDEDGNPFSIREIFIKVSVAAVLATSAVGVSDQNGGVGDSANLYVDSKVFGTTTTLYKNYCIWISSTGTTTWGRSALKWTHSYNGVESVVCDKRNDEDITEIRFGLYPWVPLEAGTLFEFWGR